MDVHRNVQWGPFDLLSECQFAHDVGTCEKSYGTENQSLFSFLPVRLLGWTHGFLFDGL